MNSFKMNFNSAIRIILFWCAQSSMTKEGRVCNLAGVSTGMDVVGGVPHEKTTATHMQVANVM